MKDSRLRPEHWSRIEELWQAALECPEEQRAAFLEQACAGNEDLRREVESLLAHDAQAESFLETPPADAAADVLSQEQGRLAEGQFIAHYRALSLLGVGGMGEVYLAEDTRLRRRVALKLLPARFTENQDRVIRFEQEARAASALNHPNIVTIHEIGHIEGKHFIVNEFIEGETLRQRITRKRMALRETLDAAIQIASALSAAHAAGIIHRDIKPENIMVRPDGLIKVLDFGLAKLVEDQTVILEPEMIGLPNGGTNTETRAVLGTLRYMSPEQAMGQPVDTRTDIFSLGVVLYEMVTGSSPFRGDSAADVLRSILNEEPPLLADAVPGTPSELEWIERKALAKERDERYQTIRELLIDLKRLKQELELKQKLDSRAPARVADSARTQGDGQIVDRQAASRGRGRKTRSLLLIAALATFTMVAFYAGRNLPRPPAFPEIQPLTFRSGSVKKARYVPDDAKTVFFSAAFDGGPIQTYRVRVDGGLGTPKFGPAGAALQSVSKTEVFVLLDCIMDQGACHHGTLASLPMNGDDTEPTVLRKEKVWEAEWSEAAGEHAIISMVDGEFQLELGKDVLYTTPNRLSCVRVSPDGKMVAFIESPKVDDVVGRVKILDHSGNRIAESGLWTTAKGLAWSPKGDKVLFSAGETRILSIRSLALSGDTNLVYTMIGDVRVEDISSDGQILAFDGGPRSRIAGTPDPRNLAGDWPTAADLSADAKSLLYYEWGFAVDGAPQVLLLKLDGKSEPQRLGAGKALALSPNGDSVLAFRSTAPKDPTAPENVIVIPINNTENTRELPRGKIREYLSASWLDDNQIVISGFDSEEKYARSYIQDVREGLPRIITYEGDFAVLVSPDATKLVVKHTSDDSYYLHESPFGIKGPDPVRIDALYKDDEPIQWKDAFTLYVRRPEILSANIELVDLRSGKRKSWNNIPPPDPVGNNGITGRFVITPDGSSYVYTFWTALTRLHLIKGQEF